MFKRVWPDIIILQDLFHWLDRYDREIPANHTFKGGWVWAACLVSSFCCLGAWFASSGRLCSLTSVKLAKGGSHACGASPGACSTAFVHAVALVCLAGMFISRLSAVVLKPAEGEDTERLKARYLAENPGPTVDFMSAAVRKWWKANGGRWWVAGHAGSGLLLIHSKSSLPAAPALIIILSAFLSASP